MCFFGGMDASCSSVQGSRQTFCFDPIAAGPEVFCLPQNKNGRGHGSFLRMRKCH